MQNELTASQLELYRRCFVKVVETLLKVVIVSSNISIIKLHTNPKTSCERHSGMNGLDETKAKQIYEPRNPKRNNSKYG